jgi:hypothetical protein
MAVGEAAGKKAQKAKKSKSKLDLVKTLDGLYGKFAFHARLGCLCVRSKSLEALASPINRRRGASTEITPSMHPKQKNLSIRLTHTLSRHLEGF